MSSETNNGDESIITLNEKTLDELEKQSRELDDEYAAVLGGSDENRCSYSEGAVKRQAIYACLTCCPEARNDLEKCAGICLACSHSCHEDHELVELYTKRNFRCDCPTERFASGHRCRLNGFKLLQPRNAENVYDHNFQGLYCVCERPYPDPEGTNEDEMIQCVICEDWFHLLHLDASGRASKLVETQEEVQEMVCTACMAKHAFLQDYTGLTIKMLEATDESADVSIMGTSNVDNSMSDAVQGQELPDAATSSKLTKDQSSIEESPAKRPKLENPGQEKQQPAVSACRRLKGISNNETGPTFWGSGWREALCQCIDCMDMYKLKKIDYLLDPEDSASSYAERGKKRVESLYEQGMNAIASMGHVQKIEAIIQYNNLKEKLTEFLRSFAVNNKVVTEEDVNRFFEGMRSEQNAMLESQHSCR